FASSSATIRSVPSGPEGPCCSVPPKGTTTSVLRSRYSCTSCQRASLRSTQPSLPRILHGRGERLEDGLHQREPVFHLRRRAHVRGSTSIFAPAFCATSEATLL